MCQCQSRQNPSTPCCKNNVPPGEGEISSSPVNRNSPNYIRWAQSSLNRALGLQLTADGVMGAQTRSAIRSFQQRANLTADGKVGAQTERALIAAGASQPPNSGAATGGNTPLSASSASTSVLLNRETEPPQETLYANIRLGGEGPARAMTGIFIPQGYKPQSQVDLIIYLHGFKINPPPPTMSIDGYWNARKVPYFPLREALNQSGRNVILVAPTLGPRSQTGWLTGAGGFDRYITQVLAALSASDTFKGNTPSVRHIILACHSGGGLPMRTLALSGGRYAQNIKECWGFDCTYNTGDDTLWARWANSRPDAKLFIYYIAGSRTQILSLKLRAKNVPNAAVIAASTGSHNRVPITHWQERLRGADFLANRSEQTNEEISLWDNTFLRFFSEPMKNTNIVALASFIAPTTQPTVANALAIVKLICGYHGIPWRVAYTVLQHEGGVSLFTHNDGVMQTIQGARNANIPRIPRSLKLALLGLPLTDTTADAALVTALHREFPRRLAVQIATGVQELMTNLEKFNGYVALAYQAYNAGSGWAYYTATTGAKKAKPTGITDAQWEDMCKFGASLLHQPASAVNISQGVWQCDANIPTWFSHIPVSDAPSGLSLVAYKYLRSVTERITKNRPTTPCDQAHNRERQSGSGPIISRRTRDGSLDKLYEPNKLGSAYYQIAQTQLTPITDDGLPLKVELGKLVKMPLMSGVSNPIPVP